jgi:tRNA threonylcarbamoyladenosine biosynthesis protein TsaB
MIILTIRTDKPEAEIGLYDNEQQLGYITWSAHRELSDTIHTKIKTLLLEHATALSDVTNILVFRGPGSFTGLRIGIAVANALADGLAIPIVGTMGEEWIPDGIDRLLSGNNDTIVMPEYGALPHITAPRE